MKLSLTLLSTALVAVLPSSAYALAPHPVEPPVLKAGIQMIGDSSKVRVSITNIGSEDANIFKGASVLFPRALDHWVIYQGSQKVRYQGIKIKIKTTNLGQDDFQIIPSHRTVTTIVDVGEAYNLTADGDYIISLSSDFDYAAMGSVELSTGGHFRLASGPINAAIDGKKAEKSFLRYHGRKNS